MAKKELHVTASRLTRIKIAAVVPLLLCFMLLALFLWQRPAASTPGNKEPHLHHSDHTNTAVTTHEHQDIAFPEMSNHNNNNNHDAVAETNRDDAAPVYPAFRDFVVRGEVIRIPRETRWDHLLPMENIPEYRLPSNFSMSCSTYGLVPRQQQQQPESPQTEGSSKSGGKTTSPTIRHNRQIFFVNTYNNEIPQLLMKLDEIYPVVDYIVLIEGRRTFQFEPKPVYFHYNSTEFGRYDAKILHHVYHFDDKGYKWKQEMRARREGYHAIAHLVQEGDLILSADVDEIPRREALQLLRDCELSNTTKSFPLEFSLDHFEYSFQYMRDQQWDSPVAAAFQPLNKYRAFYRGLPNRKFSVPHAGWHCSWFFSPEGMLHKVMTYSHTEYRGLPYTNTSYIVEKICNNTLFTENRTLVNRYRPEIPMQSYDMMSYVLRNAAELQRMLPGENAGVRCM